MDANLIAKISAIIAAHPAVNERLMIGKRLAADDLARKVIAAEREKCATVADEHAEEACGLGALTMAKDIAAAIRALTTNT